MVRRTTLGLLLFTLATSWSVSGSEQVTIEQLPQLKQEEQHKTAAVRVTDIFTQAHYKEVSLDDAFSSAVFERYLRLLDYNKQVFTQDDVAGFEAYRTQLDDILKSGQLKPAFMMFQQNIQRRFERYEFALSLLEKPFDFTVDESLILDRKEADWPADKKALDELWRKRVKADALNLKLAGKKHEEIASILGKRYRHAMKRLTQTKSEDVFQSFMNAFARTIEPHTSYLSPRNADRFKQEINLSLEGIGAVLQSDFDYTVIRSLVPGGPAARSEQLKPEDKIIGVAQDDEEIVNVIGWRLDEVVELIKGPKGSGVTLEIQSAQAASDGGSKLVKLVRDEIRLEDQAAKSEIIESASPGYQSRKLGLISIPSFYNGLSADVKALLDGFKDEAIEGVVIDLRGNGGGSLPESIMLTGLFIDRGPVVQVRNMVGRVRVNADTDGVSYYDGPMTILVDRYSASASEIFSAALQDYGRALIIGEQTFGKGTVQQHRELSKRFDFFDHSLGDIQFTIAKFYRIDGGSTQHRGVIPDILMPTEALPGEYGESMEEHALPWDSITRAKYATLGSPHSWVTLLDGKLQKRMAANPEFVYVFEDIERFKQEKERKTLSLNEQQRKAQREADQKRYLARENERRKRQKLEPLATVEELDSTDSVAPDDLYLDEAINITLDMIDAPKFAKAS